MVLDEQEMTPQPEGEKLESEAAATSNEVAELRKALEEKTAESERYLDQWRRTTADFANYRKWQEKERQQMADAANALLFSNLIPVLDDFERALDKVPVEAKESDWVQGVRLVERKMRLTLEKAGLKEIALQEGDPFDPNVHEALHYEENGQYPEGSIMQVLQRGYKVGERLLRPALVTVSKGPGNKGSNSEPGSSEKPDS